MEGKQHILGILGPVSAPLAPQRSSDFPGLAVVSDHVFCNSSHLFQDSLRSGASLMQGSDRFNPEEASLLKLKPWSKLGNLSLEWSIDEAETEIVEFVTSGGVLLCETSPRGQDRKPERLFELARRLHPRVNLVVGTGWSPQAEGGSETEKSMEDAFRKELEQGFALEDKANQQYVETHQKRTRPVGRAGLIGEIAVAEDMLRVSGSRSEIVLRAARTVQLDVGCAVLVNVSAGGVGSALELAEKVIQVFQEAHKDCSKLALSGLTSCLPLLFKGVAKDNLFRSVASLIQRSNATLVVSHAQHIVPGSNDLATVVALVKYLVEHGLGDRLVVGQDTRFKSHLRRFGGFGYAYAQWVLCTELQQVRVGLSRADLKKIMMDNSLKLLSYWQAPAKPEPLPETFWHCDYCNKKKSESFEPFTFREYRYCSMKCLKQHKQEINSKDKKPPSGGGGSRQRGTNGTGWGIAVGSA